MPDIIIISAARHGSSSPYVYGHSTDEGDRKPPKSTFMARISNDSGDAREGCLFEGTLYRSGRMGLMLN